MNSSEFIGFLFAIVLVGALVGGIILLFHAIKGTHSEIEANNYD